MSDTQLANIERSIGSLQSDVKAVLREIARDREDARQHRESILDRVSHVEERLIDAKTVAAAARQKADETSKLVSEEIKPQTDRLKNLGVKGGGFLAGAALIGGFAVPGLWSAISNVVKELFR